MMGLRMFLAISFVLSVGIARSQDSPHGALSIPCERCHATQAWTPLLSPLLFSHDSTGFPLEGRHIQVKCRECHRSLDFAKASRECVSCHADVHRGELGKACERCHTTRTSLVPDMADRHRDTRFPLVGAHRTAPCRSCHVNEQKYEFAGAPTACFECHKQEYRAAAAPNHLTAGFGVDCVQCHAPSALTWGGTFNHSQTAFPLLGAHPAVPCVQCHAGNRFRGTPAECSGCHMQQYTSSINPPHAAAGFPTDCRQCHTLTAWKPATFNHTATGFALTGAHAVVPCSQCHRNNVYAGTATTCNGCHQADYTRVVSPRHTPPSFSTDCTVCHSTTAWRPSGFNHSKTAYPLSGAHLQASCNACHVNGVYAGTSTQCSACHLTQYNATANPKHMQPAFSLDCQGCHTTAAWRPATFDHSRTTFPLTGAHTTTACASCHPNGQYAGIPVTCWGCHQTAFNATTAPSHISAGFPHECEVCHGTSAWKPSTFNHAATAFPLTGAHAAVACIQCHQNNVYKGTPTQCNACHQNDYTAAVNPRHSLPSFSGDCTVCHNTTAWRPSSFSHSTTRFPLTGVHVTTSCAACHVNAIYAGTPLTCVGCHQQDYNGAANPNHATSGFPTDCQSCHSTTAWQPSTFDHTKTAFPLTGAHLATPCNRCHVNNVYKGTPAQCYACHQQDYAGVASPKHTQPSFSTDCTVCHTTAAWHPSTFDHSKTTYPLTGAHVQATCSGCHINGLYAGTSKVCSACHMAQYNSTTNPNHSAAGFPNDCMVCHSTTAWSPSNWNHDPYFPISANSTHRPGRWTTCADCHTAPTNFKIFSCITCHAHDKTTTDSHHTQVRNYSYDSQACYSCHPRGSGG